jgi:NTP pyrophosphatase (non-canonical NTP hydrolase)
MALSVEAAELMELYQWRELESSGAVKTDDELRAQTREELADVVIYAMSIAIQCDIDLLDAVEEKIETNEERFDPDAAEEFD